MRAQALLKKLLAGLLLTALLLPLPAMSALAEPEASATPAAGDMTNECSFLSSNKRATLSLIMDDSDKTKLTLNPSEWCGLQWSSQLTAQGLYLHWESVPAEYVIEQRGFDGATLSAAVIAGGLTQEYLPLDPNCGMVLLLSRGKGTLKGICLCRADTELPVRVHDWQQPNEKADLMLVAAAPGDEFAAFPGVLEEYAVTRALPTVLVYLTRGTDAAMDAALDALWTLGLRVRPIMGNFGQTPDLLTTLEGGAGDADATTAFIAEQLRRYKPLVLVSHAFNDGDAMRAEAYRAVRQASALAASADMFPASAETYGLWQTQKLYLRDYDNASTTVGGAGYGLVTTAIGADVACDDLFENIPETAYAGYVPPEATPTPVATKTPYTAPTPTVAPTEVPDSVLFRRVTTRAWLVLAALLFIIFVLVIVLIVRVTREWRRTGVPGLRKKPLPEDAEKPAAPQAETPPQNDPPTKENEE